MKRRTETLVVALAATVAAFLLLGRAGEGGGGTAARHETPAGSHVVHGRGVSEDARGFVDSLRAEPPLLSVFRQSMLASMLRWPNGEAVGTDSHTMGGENGDVGYYKMISHDRRWAPIYEDRGAGLIGTIWMAQSRAQLSWNVSTIRMVVEVDGKEVINTLVGDIQVDLGSTSTLFRFPMTGHRENPYWNGVFIKIPIVYKKLCRILVNVAHGRPQPAVGYDPMTTPLYYQVIVSKHRPQSPGEFPLTLPSFTGEEDSQSLVDLLAKRPPRICRTYVNNTFKAALSRENPTFEMDAQTVGGGTTSGGFVQAFGFQISCRGCDRIRRSHLRSVRLQITFDGADSPQVDTPLGLLFGLSEGEHRNPWSEVTTGPSWVFRLWQDGASNTTALGWADFLMPFFRTMRIRMVLAADARDGVSIKGRFEVAPIAFLLDVLRLVANRSSAVPIEKDLGYFNLAVRGGIADAYDREDFIGANVSSWGNVVHHVAFVETNTTADDPPVRKDPSWESDARLMADGRETPFFWYTGVEDYALTAHTMSHFSDPGYPLFGSPSRYTLSWASLMFTMYSTQYVDFLPFQGNFVLAWMHGQNWAGNDSYTWAERHSNYETVKFEQAVFFYGRPEQKNTLILTDTLQIGDAKSESSHRHRIRGAFAMQTLRSMFEGIHDRRRIEHPTRVILPVACPPNMQRDAGSDFVLRRSGSYPEELSRGGLREACVVAEIEFRVAIDPANRGVVIRRTLDYYHIDQHAQVWIDGVRAPDWLTLGCNRKLRWREEDYRVEPRFSAGKSRLDVRLRVLKYRRPPNAACEGTFDHERDWDEASLRALLPPEDRDVVTVAPDHVNDPPPAEPWLTRPEHKTLSYASPASFSPWTDVMYRVFSVM
ncbi:hypothetical protein DFJ74DRAFT_705455 [Hyaloraphidium curvatum]|nr:hypothetical protein DFJ74DRAFT_705455 [Hyaloraphidium curvatum]